MSEWISTEKSLPEVIHSKYHDQSLVYQVLDIDGFIKTAVYDEIGFWVKVDIAFCDGAYTVNNYGNEVVVVAYCELPNVGQDISDKIHKEFHKYDT